MSKNILIIAGEASGDLHAAKLVNDVRTLDSTTKFFGIGGTKMRQAGVNILIDSSKLAVIGLDMFLHIPEIFKAFKTIRHVLLKTPPDLVILVDYPGFNLRVAKLAKKANVKVLYYISPKLWASRQYRIKTIRKYVDKIAVIFPFEIDFYKKFGINAIFVGNPLAVTAKPNLSKQQVCELLELNSNNKIIGLFPGSRKGEIKRLLPTMLKSAELLQNDFPNIQFILPLAASLSYSDLQLFLKESPVKVKITSENIYNIINSCDAIIAASGTVTLEIALIETPMVIIYKVFPPYFPIKKIINIPYIGLCNIVAGKEIIKELLQQHANTREINSEINHILTDDNYRNNMRHELEKVSNLLTNQKTENLAALIVQMLS